VVDSYVSSQHHQQQLQQQQQLKDQHKQTCDDEVSITRQLETTSKTVEDLREQLESRVETIKGLKYELIKAKQEEIELRQQVKDDNIGIGNPPAPLQLKAAVDDMLYAFLSYTLSSNEQSTLLDSMVVKNIITAKESAEIRKLTTVEEKVLMLLSRLRRMSRVEVEQWLSTLSTVGQKHLVEAKLQTFCK